MKTFTKHSLNSLDAETQRIIKDAISTTIINGYDEKGNFAFVTESLQKTSVIKKICKSIYLEVSFRAQDYPAFNVSLLQGSEDEFKNHIAQEFGGWEVHKCQLKDLINDGEVICLIGYQVQNEQADNFEHESYEVIGEFKEARELLNKARQKHPESTWKLVPIDQETIENVSIL